MFPESPPIKRKPPAWLRRKGLALVMKHPRVTTIVTFMLLFTVSNHVYYATQGQILQSSFWHMIVMGVVMGFFGSIPMYELVSRHRMLAQVELVRAVVTTLHHEISNPLTVILGSAVLMRDAREYDEVGTENILAGSARIQEVMEKLSGLDSQIRMRTDAGFEGALDLEGSN